MFLIPPGGGTAKHNHIGADLFRFQIGTVNEKISHLREVRKEVGIRFGLPAERLRWALKGLSVNQRGNASLGGASESIHPSLFDRYSGWGIVFHSPPGFSPSLQGFT